jgi:thiamine-monophosphate kinase
MTLGPGREFDHIRRFLQRAHTTGPGVLVGPGDDCAVLSDGRVALSCDLSIEHIHFERAWLSLEDIGWRAVNAALSDLAACAARPVGALASLAVASDDDTAERIMSGVADGLLAHGAVLLGGDLTRSPGPVVLDITVAGSVVEPVLRSGAKPGNEIWVTGQLGGAAAAIRAWQSNTAADPAAAAAFRRPRARTAEALWLAQSAALRAMIDLSDGLAGDAAHLAAASGVRIVLEAATLPVHPAARPFPDNGIALALGGGDDYELCFAADAHVVEAVADAFAETFGLPLRRVGYVEAGSGVALLDAAGRPRPMPAAGFDHFASESP